MRVVVRGLGRDEWLEEWGTNEWLRLANDEGSGEPEGLGEE